MDQLWTLIHYLRDHWAVAVAAAVVLAALYPLANRKPKVAREAEERLEQLRKERADYYNTLRPLR